MNKIVLLLLILLTSISVHAQEKVEMADWMRSNGKIYTVVAVCLTILIGLFLYMISIDKKIRKMEKEVSSKKI